MDFGKFKYEKKKKTHQHTHHIKIKEIRLRPRTGEHDVQFKLKQAIGFLQHKDKVIVSVMFKGREIAHIDEGQRMLEKFVEELAPYGKVESPIQRTGPNKLTCTISPK
jgi:translation initiation factor IF-3